MLIPDTAFAMSRGSILVREEGHGGGATRAYVAAKSSSSAIPDYSTGTKVVYPMGSRPTVQLAGDPSVSFTLVAEADVMLHYDKADEPN